jgi:hypothetical protein
MVTRTNHEVSNIIQRFVDGTGDKWEWDDFCSVPMENPDLEMTRGKCINLCFTHPASDKQHFCDADGIQLLLEMVQSLRDAKK